MYGIIRRLALKLRPLRRLVEHRDQLSADLERVRKLLADQEGDTDRLSEALRRETQASLSDPGTRVALLQIAKTGGTTLAHRLFEVCEPNEVISDSVGIEHDGFGHMRRNSFERQLRALPDHILEEFRIVSGHLPFGFEASLGIKFSYVSFFRSPVERVLSGFLYGGRDQLKRDKEWLKFALHLSVSNGGVGFDNPLTRLLTGSEVLISSSPKATIWDLPRVTMADRALAIERLKRKFGFVGLTERFEDSCEMLFRLLGKPHRRSDLRLNETKLDLDTSELPAGTLRLLERRLTHDIEVYAAACDRFNEFAAAHGFAPAQAYVRRTEEGAFSSGDHAHLVGAQSAFGAAPDDVWLSCPFYRKKSGEFIGYDFAEPYSCGSVTIQALPSEPSRKLAFLVEASDDDFDRDIRRAYQVLAKTDGRRLQIELPHKVTARSWRLMRLGGRTARPLAITYLRFGQDDGEPRDLDAAAKKIAAVKSRFRYQQD